MLGRKTWPWVGTSYFTANDGRIFIWLEGKKERTTTEDVLIDIRDLSRQSLPLLRLLLFFLTVFQGDVATLW
jgi:hypothetical protein